MHSAARASVRRRLTPARSGSAVALCEQLVALGEDLPVMAFILAARAWAGLGNREQALDYRHTAATRDWAQLDVARSTQAFALFHATPERTAMLERIRQSKRQQGWQ